MPCGWKSSATDFYINSDINFQPLAINTLKGGLNDDEPLS